MAYSGTKRQMAQYIQDYLSNGVATMENSIDLRDIMAQMDMVVNAFAKKGFFDNWKLGDRNVPDSYVTTFHDVAIAYDPSQMLCYSILPARYINLPNGRGIDAIYPMQNRSATMYQVPRNFLSSFKNLNGQKLSGRDGYWAEGDKVYYTKRYDNSGISTVGIRLVIADSSAIADDAIYPIDPSSEKDIVDTVIAHFMPNYNRPQDSTMDDRRTPIPTGNPMTVR